MGVLCWSLVWCVFFIFFAIILMRKRELGALMVLLCLVTVGVLWLFLTVPWIGLQCVILVCPDDTHFFLIQDFSLGCVTKI